MRRLALFLFALPLLAEPDFTGNWILNVAKSEYGRFPKPEVMLRSVTHMPGMLTMSTYQKGAQGEVTTELKYSTDGAVSVNGDSRGTARWQGDTLIIESVREAQGTRLTQRDQWTLSPDGKTLTVSVRVTLPNGEFDIRQVFERAPAAAGARANF